MCVGGGGPFDCCTYHKQISASQMNTCTGNQCSLAYTSWSLSCDEGWLFHTPSPAEKSIIYEPISLFYTNWKKKFATKLSTRFLKNCILNTLDTVILKDPQIHFLKQQMFYLKVHNGFLSILFTAIFLLYSIIWHIGDIPETFLEWMSEYIYKMVIIMVSASHTCNKWFI